MGLGDFLSNAAKSVTSTVGSIGIGNVTIGAGTKVVSDAINKASGAVQSVPVLGPVLGITTPLHFVTAINDIASGKRVDKAALGVLKNKVKDYKAAAPYAASVVSFVPGVGQGVGAGIMAGAALAEGQPLSIVALRAVQGSLPGGPVAAMAFNAARAAAEGQPIDQVAIAALPVSQQQKDAIRAGLALAKDLAAGKRVDQALLARADDAIKVLSPELQKALTIGTSMGVAKLMQSEVVKQITSPAAKNILGGIGKDISLNNALAKAARNINPSPEFQNGFDMAVGLLHGRIGDLNMLTALRQSLSPEQQKGFDTAAALKIGIGKKLGRTVKGTLVSRKPESEKIKASLAIALKQVPPNKKIIDILNGKLKAALEKEAAAKAAKGPLVNQLRSQLESAKQRKLSTNIIKALQAKLAAAEAQANLSQSGSASALPTQKVDPAQAAGFLITQGLVGAEPSQKTAVVSDISQNPIAREGAADAIKEIAAERKTETLWDKIKKFFGF